MKYFDICAPVNLNERKVLCSLVLVRHGHDKILPCGSGGRLSLSTACERLFRMPIQLANDTCSCVSFSECEPATTRPKTMIDFYKLSYVNSVHTFSALASCMHAYVPRSASIFSAKLSFVRQVHAILITVNGLSACRHMPCKLFSTSFLFVCPIWNVILWQGEGMAEPESVNKTTHNCVKHKTFASRKRLLIHTLRPTKSAHKK